MTDIVGSFMLCIENDLLSMVVRALCMLLCVLCVLSLGGDGGRSVRDLLCSCFSMANRSVMCM